MRDMCSQKHNVSIIIIIIIMTLGIWVELYSKQCSLEVIFILVLVIDNTIHRNIVHYSYRCQFLII